MDLLAWLIAGHMAGDFLLQTKWMAGKKSNIAALLIHSGVYAATVSLAALPAGGLRVYSILAVFISHAIIDQRAFVNWWCKHITKSDGIPWLVVVADQSWHAVALAAVCILNRL